MTFDMGFELPTIRSQGERSTICTTGAHDSLGIQIFLKKVIFFIFS